MDPFVKKLYDRPINGKYVLIEKLGKGGFGVVYLGTHPAVPFESSADLHEQMMEGAIKKWP